MELFRPRGRYARVAMGLGAYRERGLRSQFRDSGISIVGLGRGNPRAYGRWQEAELKATTTM